MFYSRNKREKRQQCRHEQWPRQGRAPPREETTKYEPTTKKNISDRKLHHEDNMHYPMWKLTHLTKKYFWPKNMVFAREPKFRPKTRTTPWQKKYNGGLRLSNVGRKKKTHRERMSKIDLGKRKLWHFQEMVWKHPIHPLGNIFS